MRVLFALLFALLASAGPVLPARAQETTLAPQSAERMALARNMLQGMMIDSGALDITTRAVFVVMLPSFRERFTQAPYYNGLTTAHKQALLRSLDNLGPAFAAEAVRGAPPILDEYARPFAALLPDDQLRDAAAYYATRDGQASIRHDTSASIYAHLTSPPRLDPLSEHAQRAAQRFADSSAGQALNSAAGYALGHELGQRLTSSPALIALVRRQICAAIEDECPFELRT